MLITNPSPRAWGNQSYSNIGSYPRNVKNYYNETDIGLLLIMATLKGIITISKTGKFF